MKNKTDHETNMNTHESYLKLPLRKLSVLLSLQSDNVRGKLSLTAKVTLKLPEVTCGDSMKINVNQ